jgi:protein tyrosine phosphatase (PTP) superfamily phosphohydrolase (DUF442 family)
LLKLKAKVQEVEDRLAALSTVITLCRSSERALNMCGQKDKDLQVEVTLVVSSGNASGSDK